MKKKAFFGFLLILCYNMPSAQPSRSEGVNISVPVQVDSSELFLFGKMIDKSNKAKYGNTSRTYGGLTNLYLYNSTTKSIKSLFPNNTILVYPIISDVKTHGAGSYLYQPIKHSAILKAYIILLVQDTDHNEDGIIDDDDPVSIYICKKDGSNLTKITSKDMHVVSFVLRADQNILLVTLQKDSNNDKKFNTEDQLLYEISLNVDISRVKLTPIAL